MKVSNNPKIEESQFPEKEDLNKIEYKNFHKEQRRLPFSIQENISQKKAPNTQNAQNLFPFFANNYPISSESKEEICFINSDIPFQSSKSEKAINFENIKEEETDVSIKININSNNKRNESNKEIEKSKDTNCELQNENKNSYNMIKKMTLEQIVGKFNKQAEEQRKKEEERSKKEKEEKNMKNEEMKKREKIMNSSKNNDQDKKKENGEIEKNGEKKREESKKKINSRFHDLSSIKKFSNDISLGQSFSSINEIKQIFPGFIFKENKEKKEDKNNSKDNSKKNSAIKNQKESSEKNEIKRKKKKKTKKKPKEKPRSIKSNKINYNKLENEKKHKNKKEIIDFEDEDDEETKEIKIQQNDKINSQSKKSNGLEMENVPRKNKFDDNLINFDFDVPRRQKKIIKETYKPKAKKKINTKQRYPTDKVDLVQLYNSMENVRLCNYQPIKNEEKKEKTFGLNGRYSLRNRCKTLRPELGEKMHYVDHGQGPELDSFDIANNPFLGYDFISKQSRNQIFIKRKHKNKMLKNGGKKGDNFDILINDSEDKNNKISKDNEFEESEELFDPSIKLNESKIRNEKLLIIPKGVKTKPTKNKGNTLIIKIHKARGDNMIKVDNHEYNNLGNGSIIRVNKNQVYEIHNFSNKDLFVELL